MGENTIGSKCGLLQELGEVHLLTPMPKRGDVVPLRARAQPFRLAQSPFYFIVDLEMVYYYTHIMETVLPGAP